MAAEAKRIGKPGIFWMNSVPDEEQPLVFVPGVNGEVKSSTPFYVGRSSAITSNKKGTKMRPKRMSGSKNQIIQKKGSENQMHLQSDDSEPYSREKLSGNHRGAVTPEPPSAFPPSSQVTFETSKTKSEVSLKDLCPEDKRRIANLIEELARVSEEKEESMQRLKDEQGNFERKIQQLEQQNVIIAQERESLQQQYRECQELLGLYQQYLSQQQAKLNQSIAQLSQPATHSKVLSSEEAHSRVSTSRANGSLFDGSYLSLAATGTQQSQVYRNGDGRRGAAPSGFRNPTSLCSVCDFSPNCRPIKQHMDKQREHRELHLCRRCEQSQSSGHDTGYDTHQQRSNGGSHQSNGHHETCNKEESERHDRGSILGLAAQATPTRSPLLGHEDWEVKKHQLLLQKTQLEMERERLQARLAEQEERLNRQSQQLRQSRLDYSSFQQATGAELSSSNVRNGGSEPEGPSHEDLPPSGSEDVEAPPAGQTVHELRSQTQPSSLHHCNNSFKQSGRDIPTSPVKSPTSRRTPNFASAVQKTPESRLDFSVVELLDIFSPVSAPEKCKPATRRPRAQRGPALAVSKPLNRTLLTPGGLYPPSSQQDLEESQILEDIFFIC